MTGWVCSGGCSTGADVGSISSVGTVMTGAAVGVSTVSCELVEDVSIAGTTTTVTGGGVGVLRTAVAVGAGR